MLIRLLLILFLSLPTHAEDFSSVINSVEKIKPPASTSTPKSLQHKQHREQNPSVMRGKDSRTSPEQRSMENLGKFSGSIPKGLKSHPTKPLSKIPLPVFKPAPKVIVIDPGHGGKDSGAVGGNGTLERDITFSYSATLQQALSEYGYFKVYLTRDAKTYVPLRQRVAIARMHNADLFISLHADSSPDEDARGLSVYTLSNKASDKEAERLSDSENQKEFGTIDLTHEDKDVAKLLLDLVKDDTMNNSAIFAESLAAELGSKIKLSSHAHRFAGFAVLTGIDVPSVLVELGYLSNKYEEKMLNTEEYRNKLVQAISVTINKYFEGKF